MNSNRLKNILLLVISIGITLGIAEIALRVADFPKQAMKPSIVYDPILLYKMPGNYPGVDKDGYRNSSVPEQADMVTLGDSHTYGFNVTQNNNWPTQLSRMTELSVYNLGVGGHGPLQYYYLLDRALELKPRYVIVGLLLSNDIKSICDLYLTTDYWKNRARQENIDLGYCDVAKIGKGSGQHRKTRDAGYESHLAQSKIVTLGWLGLRWARGFLPVNTKDVIVVKDDKNRTTMETRQIRNHSDYMDLGQPEISNSLAITKVVFSKMNARAREHGAQLVMLLIPSKEYVLEAYLRERREAVPKVLTKSANHEAALSANMMQWFREADIPYVDAKAAVLGVTLNQGDVYTPDSDGHPVAPGYKAYAQALHDGFFAGHLPKK